jgi:hypothetical protein
VSSFATHFTRGQEHTYDLAEIGRYYRSYRSLMSHWHKVLPPRRILDVRYEELVADLEGVARRAGKLSIARARKESAANVSAARLELERRGDQWWARRLREMREQEAKGRG